MTGCSLEGIRILLSFGCYGFDHWNERLLKQERKREGDLRARKEVSTGGARILPLRGANLREVFSSEDVLNISCNFCSTISYLA